MYDEYGYEDENYPGEYEEFQELEMNERQNENPPDENLESLFEEKDLKKVEFFGVNWTLDFDGDYTTQRQNCISVIPKLKKLGFEEYDGIVYISAEKMRKLLTEHEEVINTEIVNEVGDSDRHLKLVSEQ